MSRRCKVGQRARIIVGPNKGKVVLVVRRYLGEEIDGGRWPNPLFPWVVTTLGAPLEWKGIGDGKRGTATTIVLDDSQLEPLNDDDDGLTQSTDSVIDITNVLARGVASC